MDRRRFASLLVLAGLAGHAFFVPISIAGMQIALAVAAAGLLLSGIRPARTPLDWPALAFVAVAIFSDLVSPYGFPELISATLWRSIAGFYIVAHGLRVAGNARLVVVCAAAGLALAAAVGLVQYQTGVDVVHLLGLRERQALVDAPGVPGHYGAMGFFTSRLTYGHNAATLLALFGGALAARALEKREALFVGAAGTLGLFAVAVTFDRAAYLGLAAAGVAILAFAERRVRKALAAIAMAVVLFAALHPGVRGRFASSFSAGANPDRVFLWSRAVEIIRDHPLRGVGFANYSRALPPYYDRVDPSFFMRTWAHNLELSTLAEMGPLGLLALLWLFGAAALALLRRIRTEPFALGGLAALCALFTIGQAHDVFYDTKVMYALWLSLGLSLGPRS